MSPILASTEFIYKSGSVIQGPNLPLPRHGHCMVKLHDGKIMILGAGWRTPSLTKVFPDYQNNP